MKIMIKMVGSPAIKSIFLIAVLTGCAGAASPNSQVEAATTKKYAARKTMHAFRSEQELKSYLRELAEKQKRESRHRAGGYGGSVALAAPAAPASTDKTASFANEDSVTNTQVAGVDEGGIVKVHGNHLVML